MTVVRRRGAAVGGLEAAVPEPAVPEPSLATVAIRVR
jgi:hypothetical protein